MAWVVELLRTTFGLVGHLNVEPMSRRWAELPVLGLVATSTFHAGHHQAPEHNFGFDTLIWDRIFGTGSPGSLAIRRSAE